jgi:hypothetical protein
MQVSISKMILAISTTGNISVDTTGNIEYTYITHYYPVLTSSGNLKIPYAVNNPLTLNKLDFLTYPFSKSHFLSFTI